MSSFEVCRWEWISLVSPKDATISGMQVEWNFRIKHFASTLLYSQGRVSHQVKKVNVLSKQFGVLKCFNINKRSVVCLQKHKILIVLLGEINDWNTLSWSSLKYVTDKRSLSQNEACNEKRRLLTVKTLELCLWLKLEKF